MNDLATQPARASGEFAIGGDLPVVRPGQVQQLDALEAHT
jgi:hypothetical protein